MDIICFSHLRWNFVYQRPQHLLKRFANNYRVFFVEEPVFDAQVAHLDNSLSAEGVWIIIPHLTPEEKDSDTTQIRLLTDFFTYFNVKDYICWYYTPMALAISATLHPLLTVYDCMDELSAFKNPPPGIIEKEKELMRKADLVFTGGTSLYKAKKSTHTHIYAFPSSIDKKHFAKARRMPADPFDQKDIAGPRIGFFGVIDERMDLQLLDDMAILQPTWQFILLGPVVKIDPATLPARPNIHYLGSKDYKTLPEYLGGWDVAMMPFALNESTRFISPTKTPEYLAGGIPVVSTAIQDVINPYGDNGLVFIAHTAKEFIDGITKQLEKKHDASWLEKIDKFLEDNSWDNTVEKMMLQINIMFESKSQDISLKNKKIYV